MILAVAPGAWKVFEVRGEGRYVWVTSQSIAILAIYTRHWAGVKIRRIA